MFPLFIFLSQWVAIKEILTKIWFHSILTGCHKKDLLLIGYLRYSSYHCDLQSSPTFAEVKETSSCEPQGRPVACIINFTTSYLRRRTVVLWTLGRCKNRKIEIWIFGRAIGLRLLIQHSRLKYSIIVTHFKSGKGQIFNELGHRFYVFPRNLKVLSKS